MKKIALMPVKNEAWIIQKTLFALTQFCDVIIVADQGSTDGTLDIVHRFEKVQVIENTEKYHSHRVRTLLLNAARDFDGYNLIFNFDADEIPAATILDQNVFQEILSIPQGTSVILPWIQLWRSTNWYRNDNSVWSNSKKHFLFRDDRKCGYETKGFDIDHAPRVPTKTLENTLIIDDIPVLHYQFVVFERMLAKQRWYRLLELLTTNKSAESINESYIITRDEREIHLDALPNKWVEGWLELDLDLGSFPSQDIYWHEVDALKFFAEYGVEKFQILDIWDVDWEKKRKTALAQGYSEVPQHVIRDPRTLDIKLYHRSLDRHIKTPNWHWNVKGVKSKIGKIIG